MKNFIVGLIFTVAPIILVISGVWISFRMQGLAGYAAVVAFILFLIVTTWGISLICIVGNCIRRMIEKEEKAQ